MRHLYKQCLGKPMVIHKTNKLSSYEKTSLKGENMLDLSVNEYIDNVVV